MKYDKLTKLLLDLIQLAHDRGHYSMMPLPGKQWDDCFDIQCGMAMLHYHIPEDKSSKAVHIELTDS